MRSVGGIHRTDRLSAFGRGICTSFVVVLASCSDPSPPSGPPAFIRLMTEAAVTVPVSSVFPVRVLVSDADQRAVAGATVVFLVQPDFLPIAPHADTVRTDVHGEAKIDAAIRPYPGQYKIIVTVANAQLEPAVVSVSVTPDTIFSLEIVPDNVTIAPGMSVQLIAHAWHQFGAISRGTFRTLTPAIIEISAAGEGTATVTGLAPGTGLIVAQYGQLTDTATVRVEVVSLWPLGLALGAHHSCVLYADGKVYCWGAVPGAGESGEDCGGSRCLRTPRLIASTVRFEAIAAGGDQTCARSGGALYCWGRGGAVPGGESATPQRVPGNFSFTGPFAVGRDHACATIDGAAYCWGDNSRGQLGTGNRIVATTPTAVLSTQRFLSLRAGPQFTCGETMENRVYCWGANSHGELGRGTVSESELVPAAVPGLYFVWLSAGAGAHMCAYSRINHVTLCWGRNDAGQLGDGTVTSSSTPRLGAHHLYGLVTTASSTCGTDGRLGKCWGSIGGYQYDETIYYRGSQLTAGDQHACAYIGGLRCWGDNSLGALGDGTLKSSRVPVAVAFY